MGMKCEGIDPRHPSQYCVMTVAEVRGYRLRMHFDGYSECYDFWTNADSPFLFPAGWCDKNNKKLNPPKGCHLVYLCDTKISITVATTSLLQIFSLKAL